MGTKPVASAPADRPGATGTPTKVNEMPEPDSAPEPVATPVLTSRLHRLLDRIRANPTGRMALRITVGVLGAIVVAVGIALIPLPGPGWALVILGLAIWAVEFHWAKRLLTFTKHHVRSWTQWIGRQSLGLRFGIGAVGLVFVSAVVWASAYISLDINLVTEALDLIDRT
jgi:uncharacterized protein (TIGR02611 family)